MPVFYYDAQVFKVYQVKQLLDDAHIPCLVKNDFAQGAVGEIAPLDSAPEIWLVDEQWRPKAQQLVDNFLAELQSASDAGDWVCGACQTDNEASFGICWSCQSGRE
ncbi:MAG: DUF2007 domain-containing protein [Glaciecola sp.]